jgi:uncharacterized protein YjbJ (UPF0337 family)
MSINKDRVEGRLRETEGKIKEMAGKVTGDEKLEVKDKVQGIVGEAQSKFGDIKQDVKDSSRGI